MPDPHTPDIAAQIAAELDALCLEAPITQERDEDGKPYAWYLHFESPQWYRVSVYTAADADAQALIVGWVMAECTRCGWMCVTRSGGSYEEGAAHRAGDWDRKKHRFGCECNIYRAMDMGVVGADHPTSLALAALRAYRQACEAEVRHG